MRTNIEIDSNLMTQFHRRLKRLDQPQSPAGGRVSLPQCRKQHQCRRDANAFAGDVVLLSLC